MRALELGLEALADAASLATTTPAGRAIVGEITELAERNLPTILKNTVCLPMLERTSAEELLPTVKLFADDDELARLYQRVSGSVGKIEGIESFHASESTLPIGFGSAFSVGKGRMLTANHVPDSMKDFWIVDRTGAVHEADVLKPTDEVNDLAVLQLRNPASYHAFRTLPMHRKRLSSLRPSDLYGFGHPDSVNPLVVSPGVHAPIPFDQLQSHRLLIPMNLRAGNSGSPIVTKSAHWAGVAIEAGPSATGRYARATDVETAAHLLRSVDAVAPRASSATTYERLPVSDRAAARTATEKYWQRPLNSNWGIDEMHARFSKITSRNDVRLSIRGTLDTNSRRLTLRPVALNEEPIPAHVGWGDAALRDTHISVLMDSRFRPAEVRAYNDPTGQIRNIIGQGLNLKYML